MSTNVNVESYSQCQAELSHNWEPGVGNLAQNSSPELISLQSYFTKCCTLVIKSDIIEETRLETRN